jgi:hypothetical protein
MSAPGNLVPQRPSSSLSRLRSADDASSVPRRGALWVMLSVLWCAATATVSYLLFVRPPYDLYAGDAKVVGTLTSARGAVKVRPDASIIWTDGTSGADLRVGDTIATDAGATADIRLSGGRSLELGPYTMVRLTDEDRKDGITDHLALTLVRGSVKARQGRDVPDDDSASFFKRMSELSGGRVKAPEAQQTELVIHANDKTFTLRGKEGSELGLAQERVGADPAVTGVKGTVALADTRAGTEERVSKADVVPMAVKKPGAVALLTGAPSPSVKVPPAAALAPPTFGKPLTLSGEALAAVSAPEPEEEEEPEAPVSGYAPPPPPAPPKPKPTPKPVEPDEDELQEVQPKVEEPASPTINMAPQFADNLPPSVYTPASLRNGCGAEDMPVYLEAPALARSPKKWLPFFDVQSAAGGGRVVRVYGEERFTDQRMLLPIKELCAAYAADLRGVGLSLTLRPGIVFERGGPAAYGEARRVFLGSLADFGDRPLTVHFDKLKAKDGTRAGAWLRGGPAGAGEAFKYTLHLASAAQLPALLRFISGNGRFVFSSRGPGGGAEQAHVVRDGRIIATLAGAKIKKSRARDFVVALRGAVGFIGDRSTFIDLPDARGNRIDYMKDQLSKNNEIRVLTRSRLVTLRVKDVVADPETLRLLSPTAEGVFREDVKLIVP